MTGGLPSPPSTVRTVLVVGGGTAGYLAALALKGAFPDRAVTLIESSKIPIIGVGEATTPLMPPFLHRQLGIDVLELHREVRPTWKLGIKFEWGLPSTSSFNYPFGTACPIEAYAHDGTLANQSIVDMLMAADRAPVVRGDDGQVISLLRETKLAYHLENKSFVALLATMARRAGVSHIDAEIARVVTTPAGDAVERLVLDDGRELRADLYVDASGFRSLLIEQALQSPFLAFDRSLLCDSAVVGTVPQRGAIQPYTTAETMEAGWCWRIPVEGEDHRGYVYSSVHLTADQARAEMQAKNPGLRDAWTLRFRSGRHREFWKGNTIAIGNAYGFVEPLESTALHMVIVELGYVIGALRDADREEPDRAFANHAVGAHWDFLRWFLALHYKFNRRSDSEFWRRCRRDVDVSGLQPLLDRFAAEGPWDEVAGLRYDTGDFAFGFEGVMIILLGQQVPCPRPTTTRVSKAEWDRRVAESRALVARALPQADALGVLRQRPELLQELVSSPASWVNRSNEFMPCLSRDTGPGHPGSDLPAPGCGAFDHLFETPRPEASLKENAGY